MTLDEVLALAGELDYDGIEPRSDGNQRHGVEISTNAEQRRVIRERAAAAGVELCCIATSITYANPQTVAEQIEHSHRCIDLCGDIGSPRLRVFGGALPQGVTREQAVIQVAAALREVADHAVEWGVTVCIETHDDWSDPVHLAAVMERVAHPAVAINWDFIHPWRVGYTVAESFAIVRPWIGHVHVHDGYKDEAGHLQATWIGARAVDHRAAMQLLRSIAYDGYLSGEWIGREPGYAEHLPRELATLRGYAAATQN